MEEIWKPIPGYEGLYEVSNLGRVKSLPRYTQRFDQRLGCNIQVKVNGGIRRLVTGSDGYLMVALSKDGIRKTLRVSRAVAMAFIPNPNDLPEVNHKNENITDNRADNLEWCEGLYNIRYGTAIERRSKKLEKQVEQVDTDGNVVATYDSIFAASKATGYDRSSIGRCCKGNPRHKTIGGYRWRYKE